MSRPSTGAARGCGMEVAPELRARSAELHPLPGSARHEQRRRHRPHGRVAGDSVGRATRAASRRADARPGARLAQLRRWYASPSGMLAGRRAVLLAVGFVAARPVAADRRRRRAGSRMFLPYRFLREQRRTDRQLGHLRDDLRRDDQRRGPPQRRRRARPTRQRARTSFERRSTAPSTNEISAVTEITERAGVRFEGRTADERASGSMSHRGRSRRRGASPRPTHDSRTARAHDATTRPQSPRAVTATRRLTEPRSRLGHEAAGPLAASCRRTPGAATPRCPACTSCRTAG